MAEITITAAGETSSAIESLEAIEVALKGIGETGRKVSVPVQEFSAKLDKLGSESIADVQRQGQLLSNRFAELTTQFGSPTAAAHLLGGEISQLSTHAKGLGVQMGASFQSIEQFGTGAVVASKNYAAMAGTIGVVVAAVAAIPAAFAAAGAAAISAANEEEDALDALEDALSASGQGASGLSEQYSALADAFQRTTAVGDEQLLPLMGKLVSIGQIQSDQMERATQVALDYAEGAGVGLEAAFTAVAKAAQGHTEALGKMGIEIEKTGDQAADFEAVLAALEGRFGGAAKVDTFSGALAQVGNRLGDIGEKFGEVLKSGLAPLLPLAGKALDAFEAIAASEMPRALEAAAEGGAALADILEGPLGAALSAAEVFVGNLVKQMEFYSNTLQLARDAAIGLGLIEYENTDVVERKTKATEKNTAAQEAAVKASVSLTDEEQLFGDLAEQLGFTVDQLAMRYDDWAEVMDEVAGAPSTNLASAVQRLTGIDLEAQAALLLELEALEAVPAAMQAASAAADVATASNKAYSESVEDLAAAFEDRLAAAAERAGDQIASTDDVISSMDESFAAAVARSKEYGAALDEVMKKLTFSFSTEGMGLVEAIKGLAFETPGALTFAQPAIQSFAQAEASGDVDAMIAALETIKANAASAHAAQSVDNERAARDFERIAQILENKLGDLIKAERDHVTVVEMDGRAVAKAVADHGELGTSRGM